jgi:hypothetical protein
VPLTVDLEHFRARLLQDALTEATAAYWVHRAYQFQQAAPKRGDFHGQATRAQLAAARTRCLETALACRRRAQLSMDGRPEEIGRDVLDALDEVT